MALIEIKGIHILSPSFTANLNLNFNLSAQMPSVDLLDGPRRITIRGTSSPQEKTREDPPPPDAAADRRSSKVLTHKGKDYCVLLPTDDGSYEFDNYFSLSEFGIQFNDGNLVLEGQASQVRVRARRPTQLPGTQYSLKSNQEEVTLDTHLYYPASKVPSTIPQVGPHSLVFLELTHPQRGEMHYVLLPKLVDVPAHRKRREANLVVHGPGRTTEYVLEFDPFRKSVIKLGDGSFGVVFKLRDLANNEFALKILYQKQFSVDGRRLTLKKDQFRACLTALAEKYGGDRIDIRALQPSAELDLTVSEFAESIMQLVLSVDLPRPKNGADSKIVADLLQSVAKMQEQDSISRYRFEMEKETDSLVRAALAGKSGQPAGYVRAVDSTQEFLSSGAFHALKEVAKFDKEVSIGNLSNYAIIFEYCDFTLRDALEAKWAITYSVGTGRSKTADVPTKTRTLLGYHLLQLLPFNERLIAILPFLAGAAEGLKVLHMARKLHHDIKPGNVFIKKLTGGKFDVLVGDFSFLGTEERRESTETRLKDVVGTGTTHFRSPEQRDIVESYQAQPLKDLPQDDVFVRVNGEKNIRYKDFLDSRGISESDRFYLRIWDPKANSSVIERGDLVVFSRDGVGTIYRIEDIVSSDEFFDIWLSKNERLYLNSKFVRDATRTHVVIYKSPSVKSDWFGFGALTYDMLTGGKSPERFYDDLQTIDRGGVHIDELERIYRRFERGAKIDDERYSIVFKHFRRSTNDHFEQAPWWIARIVIQCMSINLGGSLAAKYAGVEAAAPSGFDSGMAEVAGILNDYCAKLHASNIVVNQFLLNPVGSAAWDAFEAEFNQRVMQKTEAKENNVAATPRLSILRRTADFGARTLGLTSAAIASRIQSYRSHRSPQKSGP